MHNMHVAILFWNKPYELRIISTCKNTLLDTYYNLLQRADAVLFNRVQLKLDPMYDVHKNIFLYLIKCHQQNYAFTI